MTTTDRRDMTDSPAKPLRIAQVSPAIYPVPPGRYGGTERMVSYLTEALVDLGHEVTLFSSGDSQTAGRLVATIPTCLSKVHMDDLERVERGHYAAARREADGFDIVHLHDDWRSRRPFMDMAPRTLTTVHYNIGCQLSAVRPVPPMFPLVAISDSQRRGMPLGNWVGRVHHGIPSDLYAFSPEPGPYLAFIGRLEEIKQPHEAVRIAQAAGLPIHLAGREQDLTSGYCQQKLLPLLSDPGARFVGEVDDRQKNGFLGQARALLFPIAWEEPFGLVMIEAMATGTPVIAYRRGAVPEVVEDGVTGFIVDTAEEAVAAVARLPTLDRRTIRRRFEERFSARRMAEDYVALYIKHMATRPPPKDASARTRLQLVGRQLYPPPQIPAGVPG